jgi:hypothetical protein
MPIVVTFDLENYVENDHTRIRTFFETLGWQRLGGTAFRYPHLGAEANVPEDWFNHVVPALMLLRTYAVDHPSGTLSRFSVDVQSSTGFDSGSGFGSAPTAGAHMPMHAPRYPNVFPEDKVREWIDVSDWPY